MDLINGIIDTLITVFTVINFLLYLYSWIGHKKTRPLQLLLLYLTSLLVTHAIMLYTVSNGINNLYVSHIYFGLQFLFLGLFYRSLFNATQRIWVVIIMSVVYAILGWYYITKPGKILDFNLIDIFITAVPLIFFSIVHLYNMLTQPNRYYYINAGILMYLSTSTLIFFLGTHLMVEGEPMGFTRETALNIWSIQNALYLICLIFFTIEWKKNISKWKSKIN